MIFSLLTQFKYSKERIRSKAISMNNQAQQIYESNISEIRKKAEMEHDRMKQEFLKWINITKRKITFNDESPTNINRQIPKSEDSNENELMKYPLDSRINYSDRSEIEPNQRPMSANNPDDYEFLKYITFENNPVNQIQTSIKNVQHEFSTTLTEFLSPLNDSVIPTTPTEKELSVLEKSREINESFIDVTGLSNLLENERICPVCEKEFRWKSVLKRHLAVHSGKKLFICDICQKGFSQKCRLVKHKLSHTRVKTNELSKYICHECEREFSAKSLLKRHFSVHLDEKPFNCDICRKGFKLKYNLKKHQVIHTGVKCHKCELCAKAFSSKSNLQSHALVHLRDKPFSCDVCSKAFPRKHALTRHILSHTKEKPFKCEVCGKAYADIGSLKRHNIIHKTKWKI